MWTTVIGLFIVGVLLLAACADSDDDTASVADDRAGDDHAGDDDAAAPDVATDDPGDDMTSADDDAPADDGRADEDADGFSFEEAPTPDGQVTRCRAPGRRV